MIESKLFSLRSARIPGVVLIASLAAAGPAVAGQYDCIVEPSRIVEVGSSVMGVLERVGVDRGDLVKKDQIVAQLVANVERAALISAESRAAAVSAEAESAKAAKYFASRKSTRSNSLFEQSYISAQAKEQDGTEAAMASMRHNQATEQSRNAMDEISLARVRLAERTIKAPISGVVTERYMQPGERVEEKPILRIAATNPLKVEVVVPAADYLKFKMGAPAIITPDGAFKQELKAKVSHIDKVIDAASNTFRVRLELPNPNNALPAGLRCKMGLEGDTSPNTPAAGSKGSGTDRTPTRIPTLPGKA